jgi:hypothetical protein
VKKYVKVVAIQAALQITVTRITAEFPTCFLLHI